MNALMVTRAEAGQKLLNFLSRRTEAGNTELHKWIRSGQVRINGSRAKAFDRVEEGDAVRVPPFAVPRGAASQPCAGRDGPTRPEKTEKNGRIPPVIYEDIDLLVLNKPAGLPVQDGSGHADSVASRLARAYARADFVPAPVHRLDKDTSGLLLIGKTYAALRALTDALAGRGGRAPVKEYLAWTWGDWPHSGLLELRDMLDKDEAARRVRTRDDGSGREARCLACCLERRGIGGRSASLLLVRLLTGRTHQIRVQLSSRGFPLVGDRTYGPRERRPYADGLKLHAFRLELPPPWSRSLEAAPPWTMPWEWDARSV